MVQDYTLDHQDIWKGTFCPQFLILCDKIAYGSIRVTTWSPKTFCRHSHIPLPKGLLALVFNENIKRNVPAYAIAQEDHSVSENYL